MPMLDHALAQHRAARLGKIVSVKRWSWQARPRFIRLTGKGSLSFDASHPKMAMFRDGAARIPYIVTMHVRLAGFPGSP
jgi:hypothetical protein